MSFTLNFVILRNLFFVFVLIGLICQKSFGQKLIDFYVGYNLPILQEIPSHFQSVNRGYQLTYPNEGEFAMSSIGTGYFWGLRMNFGDDRKRGIPVSLEYNYYRKRNYSNRAFFPDKNLVGQYRMRYGCHSVGFVFGGVGSPVRFGLHYNFGNVHWQKKYYPPETFDEGKWVDYVETIELFYWKGPLHDALNFSLILRWWFLEVRPYYMLTFGEVRYPDYTNYKDYYFRLNNYGITASVVFTRLDRKSL